MSALPTGLTPSVDAGDKTRTTELLSEITHAVALVSKPGAVSASEGLPTAFFAILFAITCRGYRNISGSGKSYRGQAATQAKNHHARQNVLHIVTSSLV